MAAPWSRGPASTSPQTRPCWRWVASGGAGGDSTHSRASPGRGGACGCPSESSSAQCDPGPGARPPDLVRSRWRPSLSPHKAETFSFQPFFALCSKASWPLGVRALHRASGPAREGWVRVRDSGVSLDLHFCPTSCWLCHLRQCPDHTGLRSVTFKHLATFFLSYEKKASP